MAAEMSKRYVRVSCESWHRGGVKARTPQRATLPTLLSHHAASFSILLDDIRPSSLDAHLVQWTVFWRVAEACLAALLTPGCGKVSAA
jgi:hypothetical protein